MAKLKQETFKFYKSQVDDDITIHDKALKAVNNPMDILRAFEGRFYDGFQDNTPGTPDGRDGGYGNVTDAKMTENWLFIAEATLIPSLFFQLPRIVVRPKRKGLDFSAAVLTSLVNIYFNDDAKRENQLAIKDAFLAYGYAVIKNGYNSRTGKISKPSLLTGETQVDKTNDMEGDVEFLRFEKPVLLRQSPRDTYLDSTQPFSKGNRITFVYERTLKELIDSNLYKLDSNFIRFFEGRSDNPQEKDAEITLIEHWRMKNGKAHKLVYVEEWNEEISDGLQETEYDELPVSYLRFNDMGDILYTVSHGRLMTDAQKELNYLNELWKDHIDNIRNQTVVNMQKLTETGQNTLRANKIGGIVESDGPIVNGDIQPIQSAPMDPNIFNNIQNNRNYLNLISATAGPKGGGPSEKLATSERQKALGDVVRSAGLQDAIRDFVVNQIQHMIKNILRLASPEMTVTITGQNLTFPQTGQPIEPGTELELGGENGFDLRELIEGDLDVDYVFDVDITTAAKPDFPVIRKQLMEAITIAQGLEPKLNQDGKKFDFAKAEETLMATFDQIPNAQDWITEMTPEEQQAYQQAQQQAQMQEAMKNANNHEELAIASQANNVQTGVENLQP